MICIDSVTKSYSGTTVVDAVSTTIPAGGVTSIIGPIGAGKSTLLSLISRLIPMDNGSVSIAGLDIGRTPSKQLAKSMAILRQENHITMRLRVRDLVGFGRFPHSGGHPTAEDERHILQAMEQLDLTPLADRFLDELSGGQRQRAYIAMVLAQDTDYLLLDEPLNNLDMKHSVEMMRRQVPRAQGFGQDRGHRHPRHQLRLLLFGHHPGDARGRAGAPGNAR